jgi:glycosyltransferase involved in cell wall biosynthesis
MKKQDVMLQAFRALSQQGLIDWRFQCVGAVDTRPQIAPYWATIQQLASSAQINLVPDADFSHIRRIYEEGSIFWHATGFGEDADANPAAMEHFGITTAEAMAAGCVPVVINRGGQPELVQHGVNGFVWNTLDELKAFTRRLIDDEALRTRMSGAARQQAAKFSQEQFVSRFLKLTGLTTEAPRAETPPQVAHQKSSYSPGPATAAAHCEE